MLHCISFGVIAAGFRHYIVLMTPVPARVIAFVLGAGFLDVNDYLELHENMGGTKFPDVQELNYFLPKNNFGKLNCECGCYSTVVQE